MSPIAAGLVLAWLAIALMALAMAGMLRQIRDLQRALAGAVASQRAAVPVQLRPIGDERYAAVLLVAEHCAVCHAVAPTFAEMAAAAPLDLGFILLASDAAEAVRIAAHVDISRVRVVGDGAAYHRVDPGLLPALVLVDEDGQVVATEPVGSSDAARAVLAQFVGWRANQTDTVDVGRSA